MLFFHIRRLYWISPFTYGLTSAALNEFQSSRYSAADESSFLALYAIPNDRGLVWGGIGFLLGVMLLFTAFSALALTRMRAELTNGTRREDAELVDEEQEEAEKEQRVAIDVHANGLPPQPAPCAVPSL